MHAQFGACGRFQLKVTRPDGATRIAADWQPNLLTDAGLKSFGAGQNESFYSGYAQMEVGSGAGTPSATDTALFNLVASIRRRDSYNNQGGYTQAHTTTPPYYESATITWVFGKGAAAGNLTELGVRSYSPDKLLSHALIKDSTGTPTSITVAADEVLTVVYELRFYLLDTSDQTGTVTLDGVATAFTLRPSRVDQGDFYFNGILDSLTYYLYFHDTNAALGPITGTPSGGNSIFLAGARHSPQGPVSISNGVVSRSATFTVAATQLNGLGGDVKIVLLKNDDYRNYNRLFGTQIEFNPPFTKDNTKEFAFTLHATWQRYTP